MDSVSHSTLCTVCGYDLGFQPWTEESGASHEICPSCGIQFGFDDVKEELGNEVPREQIYIQWRGKWISEGMRWFSQGRFPPPDWNPRTQLKRIGVEV